MTKKSSLDEVNGLLHTWRVLVTRPDGISDIELARETKADRATAYRRRSKLNAVEVAKGRFAVRPDFNDIELAYAILKAAGLETDDVQNRLARAIRKAVAAEFPDVPQVTNSS